MKKETKMVGKRGMGLWGKRNPQWYACTVKADNDDGTLKVQWDEDHRYTFCLPMNKFRPAEWCKICFDERDDLDKMIYLESCSDVFCKKCVEHWLTECERTFRSTAQCPKCKSELCKKEVVAILGRAYKPAEVKASRQDEGVPVDLQLWLDDHECKRCGNCGLYIEREEGCDAMMCLCGYRFCYECMVSAELGCDCGHSDFYDNVRHYDTDEVVPVATLEEVSSNWKGFMKAWSTGEYGNSDDDDDESKADRRTQNETEASVIDAAEPGNLTEGAAAEGAVSMMDSERV